MNAVFVDTGGWMACADRSDPAHVACTAARDRRHATRGLTIVRFSSILSLHRIDTSLRCNDGCDPTMIDLAILGLLTEQELHGYELKKRLGELLARRASVSFGSLYPALARLEAQGCVKAVEQRTVVPSAPMTG